LREAEAIEQFSDAMRAAGLVPPEISASDKVYRFSTNGKTSDDAGRCYLFLDLLGGVFSHHRSGLYKSWQAATEHKAFMRLVICADDDRWTQGNPGITEAAEVASAVNADIAILRFEDLSERPTDFNDMHQHSGLDVVRTCIDNAKAPAKDMNQSSAGNVLNRAAANSIEAEAIGACAADKRISYRRASDIQAEPIPWL
jgi:hypothetical protein